MTKFHVSIYMAGVLTVLIAMGCKTTREPVPTTHEPMEILWIYVGDSADDSLMSMLEENQ